jgi:hypothetical protein
MKYTVVWKPAAEQQLAQLWISAPDRAEVTAAANAIDAVLSQDPLAQGEARSDGERIFFVEPLAVLFRVADPDRLVTVLAVWRWPKIP